MDKIIKKKKNKVWWI